MAIITRIGNKNGECFAPILPEVAVGDQILRMGVISDENKPVGAVEVNLEDGYLEINSIYVLENERRKGYGGMLFDAVERLGSEDGLLGITCNYGNDEELNAFFESKGCLLIDGDYMYTVSFSAVLQSDLARKHGKMKSNSGIKRVKDLLNTERRNLPELLLRGDYGGHSLELFDFDESLSVVHVNEVGRTDACFIVSLLSDKLFVDLLYSESKDPKVILYLMQGFFGACMEDSRDLQTISFFSMNNQALALMERIVPSKKLVKSEIVTRMAIKVLKGNENG